MSDNNEYENEYESEEVESEEVIVETKSIPKKNKSKIEEVPLKKKRTRTMTPELLEKLSVARKMAQEKRREMGSTSRTLKSQKDKQNELNKKKVLYQEEKLRKLEEEINTLKVSEPEVEEKKEKPKKKKVVIEVEESDSESESEVEIKKKVKKVIKKKKKKPVVVVESESDSDSYDEDEYNEIKKRLPHRGKPEHDPSFNECRSEKVNLGAQPNTSGQQQHHKFEKELVREKPTLNMQLYRNLFPN
jgi:hypothetical protein